jgi:FkbM family methyltransferase
VNILEHISKLLAPISNPVVVELGACNGDDTRQIIAVLPKPFSYFAWEPSAEMYDRLCPQMRDNMRSLGVTFVPKAVAAVDGLIRFWQSNDLYCGSSSIRKPAETLTWWPDMRFEERMVEAQTLDSFAAEHALCRIDFIWADIQGAEADMIEGGRNILARTRYLYTEFSDHELYEGEIGLNEIINRLPGRWWIVEKWDTNGYADVLLRNMDFIG